jgi:hypothetical protein
MQLPRIVPMLGFVIALLVANRVAPNIVAATLLLLGLYLLVTYSGPLNRVFAQQVDVISSALAPRPRAAGERRGGV